jgi:hypothetical protein
MYGRNMNLPTTVPYPSTAMKQFLNRSATLQAKFPKDFITEFDDPSQSGVS